MTDSLYGEKILIDTEEERSILEYRPKVEYEKKVQYEVNFPVEATTEQDETSQDNQEDYQPIADPAEQYTEFADYANNLAQMIGIVEERIKDTKIVLNEKQIARIEESAPIAAPSLIEGGVISFETYKKTFEDPENPVNSLIQDVVTEYAEDVEGNLDLEFYEDLKELELTLQEGYFLFKEAILKHYMDAEIPPLPKQDEDFTKAIDAAVRADQEEYAGIKLEYDRKEKDYYESLRTEYGSPAFFDASAIYMKKKRPHDIAIREQKSLKEMGSLVDGLLLGTKDCVNAIKSRLVLGSDIDREEVMKVLENQTASTEQRTELMKLAQLSLKLQLNQQVQEKKQYRDVLKNINNLSRKKRAHDELLMAYELRNKMYLNMYDTLEHLESPSKKKGVEAFLNNVAGGMSLVQEEYESFLKDIYLMYASEYEVRKEKIDKTVEKENARAGYSLVLDYL